MSELKHYGVPGMKWGVRKDRSRVSSTGKRTRKEQASRKSRQDASNRRRSLSDQDLNKLVKRMESERKLKNLVEEDLRPGRTKAKKILTKVAERSATVAATALAAGAGMYIVRGGATGQWDLAGWADEWANSMRPKKKK